MVSFYLKNLISGEHLQNGQVGKDFITQTKIDAWNCTDSPFITGNLSM